MNVVNPAVRPKDAIPTFASCTSAPDGMHCY